jgi:CDP-paratose 2-epimerase
MIEDALGKKLSSEYVEQNRSGDHLCYISNLSKLKAHYPNWEVKRSLADIIDELCRVVHDA